MSALDIDSLYSDTLAGNEYNKKQRIIATQFAAEQTAWEKKNKRKLCYKKVKDKTWILVKKGSQPISRPDFATRKASWNGKMCPVNKVVDGEIVACYPSISDAARAEGLSLARLSNILHKKVKPIPGVDFKFVKQS